MVYTITNDTSVCKSQSEIILRTFEIASEEEEKPSFITTNVNILIWEDFHNLLKQLLQDTH